MLRLATRLLEKLPDVAPKFNVNLDLPDLVDGLGGGGDEEEDEALCPTLHLFAALLERGEEVEQSHCRHQHCCLDQQEQPTITDPEMIYKYEPH